MTTLPKPGAVLPALPDRTRLLDIFLAGRNPRTLAACQADLEDFRRFMEASSVHCPDRRKGGRVAARRTGWPGQRASQRL